MMRSVDFQTPQFIQIFGSEPDQFIDAVKFIENETGYLRTGLSNDDGDGEIGRP